MTSLCSVPRLLTHSARKKTNFGPPYARQRSFRTLQAELWNDTFGGTQGAGPYIETTQLAGESLWIEARKI